MQKVSHFWAQIKKCKMSVRTFLPRALQLLLLCTISFVTLVKEKKWINYWKITKQSHSTSKVSFYQITTEDISVLHFQRNCLANDYWKKRLPKISWLSLNIRNGTNIGVNPAQEKWLLFWIPQWPLNWILHKYICIWKFVSCLKAKNCTAV